MMNTLRAVFISMALLSGLKWSAGANESVVFVENQPNSDMNIYVEYFFIWCN